MQQPELRASIVGYVNKHAPFVKAILLSEFITDSEVFRYISEDLELNGTEEATTPEKVDKFQESLNEVMTGLYKDFKNQMNKLDNCESLGITVMYDKYVLRKEQISKNLLMITISDTNSLNMGALDRLVSQFKTNFAPVEARLQETEAE